MSQEKSINCIVVLGPTASGKTRLGVKIASQTQGEVISADSRQVYRGLDIGSGKDLNEYTHEGQGIPYHLIDCADLSMEYSVFHYQQDFYTVFNACRQRDRMPVLTGGTGLYLDAILQAYQLTEVREDPVLRDQLSKMSLDELIQRLKQLNPNLHNTTDLDTPARVIRAIEIAQAGQTAGAFGTPEIHPLIFGILWDRDQLRKRIQQRLEARMAQGMLEEVRQLHKNGVSWERLQSLGLEYRFLSEYLLGKIPSREALLEQLGQAIGKFAKRQRTWFRRMEKKGIAIHWIEQGRWEKVAPILRQHKLLGSGDER